MNSQGMGEYGPRRGKKLFGLERRHESVQACWAELPVPVHYSSLIFSVLCKQGSGDGVEGVREEGEEEGAAD